MVGDAEFKAAMSKLASGVAIVACHSDSGPAGVLVSSLTSLSNDPPRVLVCIAKTASAHKALCEAPAIGVSILSEADQEEAGLFSAADQRTRRFTSNGWDFGKGYPLYSKALVTLGGLVQSRIDAGTHSVVVLEISHAQMESAAPLVYFERRYAPLASSAVQRIAKFREPADHGHGPV